MASFISSSAFSTMAGAVSLVFGFASSIIVARLLGAEGTGAVAFSLWVALTAATVVNFGVPSILLRYMTRFNREETPGGGLARLLFPRFIIPVILTAIGIGIYAIWRWHHGGYGNHPPSLWVMTSLLLVSYATASFAEAAARGLNKFDETARLAFYGCLLQLPLIAVGAYFFGVAGALVGHAARHLPQAFRTIFYIRQPPDKAVELQPKMAVFGRNTWFSNVLGMLVWSRSEFFFLGIYSSTTEIGYYAAGLTLAGLVIQLPTQMIAALTPHIGKQHDENDHVRINRTYQRVMLWLCLFILPICFGGAAIMGELLPFLFGSDFIDAVWVSIVLVGFAFITALSLVPSTIIAARERTDFYLYASPIMAVISMGSFALVTPIAGDIGTAWVRTAVHTTWFVWLIIFCWRTLNVRLNILELGKVAMAAALCAGAAFGCLQLQGGLLGIIIAVPTGGLVYAAGLRLFKAIPENDVIALADNLPSALPRKISNLGIKALMLLVPSSGRNAE